MQLYLRLVSVCLCFDIVLALRGHNLLFLTMFSGKYQVFLVLASEVATVEKKVSISFFGESIL